MKLALWVFILSCAITKASDLVIQTNAIGVALGDSFWQDSSGVPPVTGYRVIEYLDCGMKLLFPYKNIRVFNFSQSGVIPDRILTNNLPQAIGLWGYQSNSFQHFGILQATDNGSYTSNQMYLQHSNSFQSPHLISSGDLTLISNPGWCANNTIDWIGVGGSPYATAVDGGWSTTGPRNNASVNAGNNIGVLGINSFGALSNSWVLDGINNNASNVQEILVDPHSGHFLSGGAKSWSDILLSRMFPSMTNVSTCVISWNGTIVSTNNCFVSGVSIGSELSFDLIEYSLPPGWDHAGDIVDDGTVTNTADLAFNLGPEYGSVFRRMFQITNIPVGSYNVFEDGENVGTISSSVLGTGWNRYTNTVGPSWRQRVSVLAKGRTKDHVNQVTLVAGSAGDQQGMVYYGSVANTRWIAGDRGDSFIANTTLVASNVFYLDSKQQSLASPVTRHIQVIPVGQGYDPAPFR